jgi:ribosomal protein L11 methylase PrmA
MPTKSFPIANAIKKKFGNKTVLDYGCAFGFVVKALRIIGVEAYGYDGSKYAINQAPNDIKNFVTTEPNKFSADLVLIKDVLEHIPENEINNVINHIKSVCKEKVILIVPLGENDKYRIIDYESDKTHLLKKDEEWWINIFKKNHFELIDFCYHIEGIKDNWYAVNPYGNGVFIFKNYD